MGALYMVMREDTDRSGYVFWLRYLFFILQAVMQTMPELLADPTKVKAFSLKYLKPLGVGDELETKLDWLTEKNGSIEFTVFKHNQRNEVVAKGSFNLKECGPLSPPTGQTLSVKTSVGFEHVCKDGWMPLGHYPGFLRIAELAFLESRNLSIRENVDRPPMPRAAFAIQLLQPVHEGELVIEIWVGSNGDSWIEYRFDLYQDDVLMAQAKLKVVAIGPNGRPISMSNELRAKFQ